MKTSSAKAKGRRAAQKAKQMMLDAVPELEDDDIIVTSSGTTGEDLMLSPHARSYLPFTVECKNVEKLNIWQAYAQACTHSKDYVPLVVFKRNHSKLLCTLEFEELLKLIDLQRDPERSEG